MQACFPKLKITIKETSFCALCPQSGAVFFYDCNEIVFLSKRLNGMERLSHPRLVLVMDIYPEVEQSNLTANKKSDSAAYSEQGSKKGLEMQFNH